MDGFRRKRVLDSTRLQPLYYVIVRYVIVSAGPFGGFHSALPADQSRATPFRRDLAADGFRDIARKVGKRVRLSTRPGNDLAYRFPLIAETLHKRACMAASALAAGRIGDLFRA